MCVWVPEADPGEKPTKTDAVSAEFYKNLVQSLPPGTPLRMNLALMVRRLSDD